MSDGEIKYETRTTKIVVVPEGEPIFGELATSIEIEAESEAYEYVVVKQGLIPNGIRIEPQEWPTIRNAIDEMIGRCRRD
jgi:hypothetical protein